MMVNSLLWADFSPERFLSDPLSMIKVDMQTVENVDFEVQSSFIITRDGYLNGLGGWSPRSWHLVFAFLMNHL